jgi:carbon monoxide dehydrogenase subunit G
MRIIRWVAFAIGMTILVSLATAYIMGRSTDSEFIGKAEVDIAKPSAEVWKVLSDPTNIPRYSVGIEKAERQGNGNWKFVGKQDSTPTLATMNYQVLEEGKRLKSKIVEAPQPISSGEWFYQVEPKGNGSKVSLDAHLKIDNPWLRFGLRYLTDVNEKSKAELTQLKTYLEK